MVFSPRNIFKNCLFFLALIVFATTNITPVSAISRSDYENLGTPFVNECEVADQGSSPTGAPASTNVSITIDGPFRSGKPLPGNEIKTGNAWKGSASSYGNDAKADVKDLEDNNKPALPGASNKNPGVALYNSSTLGGWWKVIAPNKKAAILQQTDFGPSASPMIDINAVAARSVFGYKGGNAFPTNEGTWKIEYAGKKKPAGAITKDSGGKGDAVPEDGSSTSVLEDCECPADIFGPVGKDTTKYAYNFLVGEKKLDPKDAAAIVGNFIIESGSDPINPSAENGIGAYGIAQWLGGRRTALETYAKEKDGQLNDLVIQLNYLFDVDIPVQKEGGFDALGAMGKTDDLDQKAFLWEDLFERSGGVFIPERQAEARKIFGRFGGSAVSSVGGGGDCAEQAADVKIDMENLYKDSTNVACATGTNEIRNDTGYRAGEAIPIKLCEVTNLPQTSGYGAHNGHASVNSRVSGAVYAMVEAAKKDGVQMSAISTFRTMADQQSLCPCDGRTVAIPGNSNHQLGIAIDFGGNGQFLGKGNKMWEWLNKNAAKFGYKQYPPEPWHWSPDGN